MKEKCEMYENGNAFEDNYKGDLSIILCPIKENICPYNNEGERIECHDKQYRTICKSNGLVKKTGLFKKLNGKLVLNFNSTDCIITL